MKGWAADAAAGGNIEAVGSLTTPGKRITKYKPTVKGRRPMTEISCNQWSHRARAPSGNDGDLPTTSSESPSSAHPGTRLLRGSAQ